jgi:DNA recombination protein RmuC
MQLLIVIYIVTALVIVCVVLMACMLFSIKNQNAAFSKLVLSLGTAKGQPGLGARIDSVDARVRDDGQSLRRSLMELDQGLRKEISTGVRDSLVTAFDKVQEGTKAQSEELTRFGKALQEAVVKVQGEVAALSEKMTTVVNDMAKLLVEKLTEAEKSAADGRAGLLRDTSEAIVRARESIDASLKTFGEQQGERLATMATSIKDRGDAVQLSVTEFRGEVSQRLDVVAKAAADVLSQATTTFNDIKQAIGASEEKTEKTLTEQRAAILAHITQGQVQVSEKLTRDLSELTERMKVGFDGFAVRLRDEQELLRKLVNEKLEEMRAGNEAKLEQMRKAVDEQLQTALEKSIGESFARVAEQFAQVQQAIGQVQAVTTQIGDIKRLFSNVKARGGWGEAQIGQLLDDILPLGAYQTNVKLGDGAEMVEFALRMPLKGSGDDPVWLAIDAKFPTEDYDRLVQAAEVGDRNAETEARKSLERTIKEQAKRISKYVCPPRTIDYAIMYLPTEGLFQAVERTPGLVETVRREHSVYIMSPALLPALLQMIRVGHLTLALERKAGLIGETLGAVKHEWERLTAAIDTLARRAKSLTSSIDDTQRRTRAVGRALRNVDVVTVERAGALLGIDGPEGTAASLSEPDEELDELQSASAPAS